jgi:hypothetical protein
VFVIPVIRELTPYGFIGKFQGLQVQGKTVAEVAKGIFAILVSADQTRSRMLTCLINTTLQAPSEQELLAKLDIIQTLPSDASSYLEQLREAALQAAPFQDSKIALAKLNQILEARGLATLSVGEGAIPLPWEDEEVPF